MLIATPLRFTQARCNGPRDSQPLACNSVAPGWWAQDPVHDCALALVRRPSGQNQRFQRARI